MIVPRNTGQERTADPGHFPWRILVTGVLVVASAVGSAWLMARSRAIECENMAPLTVLATLAAFLISVCFRQISRYSDRRSRWFLVAFLLVAAATLFTDFRYVRRNRGLCNQLRQQMHQGSTSP
ncbi:MAG TPA: hypothetical protein VJS11_00615 [Acidobacteriaceae bacterium]|nr:hypothetical protein [Acidobacteriaceae bacterium]